MPIEDASVEWGEHEPPYVRVAEMRIPRQSIDVPGRDLVCERSSFNPWHSLVVHRPLGAMNRVRRAIYDAMQQFRESHTVRT
jgi:sirohydrochlorin ferrochelatase